MKKYFLPILLSLLAVPASFSLFRPGIFQSDDAEWMIVRFSAFHQALADGQFPIRWLGRLNHEYGYPVANFLYPGFMYLAEPIHLLGFGFVDSIKIILGLSMIGSAMFCYLWLEKLFDKWAAFVGALFYLYTPYHLYDLYKRGSVGEVLAIAVLPFILWMIERRNFFFTTLGIGFLIVSHNTLAVLFLPFVVMYMFLRKVVSVTYIVLSIFFGLAVAAFFWIPALLDLHYTRFSQTQVSDWQDHFADITIVGISSLVMLAGIIFIKKRRMLDIFFFVLGAIGVFFSLPVSSIVWQIAPTSFVQFPFRFLSILLPSVGYLAARLVTELTSQKKTIAIAALSVILFISAIPFLQPKEFFNKGDSYYATNQDSTTVQNEYTPKWVKIDPKERPAQVVEIPDGKIENLKVRASSISFQALTETQTEVRVHKIFFPGLQLYVDNVASAFSYENDYGIITFAAHVGMHTYVVKYSETSTSRFADIVSILGFVGLLFVTRRKKLL